MSEGIPDPQENEPPPPQPKAFKSGRSIHDFARGTIPKGATLLGNRFLCRRGSLIVVAPSGLGKSTFTFQIAILWACGLVAFDIEPNGPLRILIVQSEDDEGDCIEMAMMMDQLGLNEEQKDMVRLNTEVIHCNNLIGKEFIAAVDERLTDAVADSLPFDLLIINPYSNYLGGDVADTELNVGFLHGLINPLIEKFNLGIIPVCHSPKTPHMKLDKFEPTDFQYAAAGCAAIANWTRAMLTIFPVKNQAGLFLFVAAKRGARIGDLWEGKIERYFQHSTVPGLLRWEPASQDQKKAAAGEKAKKQKSHTTKEVITQCLSFVDWSSRAQYRIAAKAAFDMGVNTADDFLDAGIRESLVEIDERPRPRTQPEKFYRRNGLSSNGSHQK